MAYPILVASAAISGCATAKPSAFMPEGPARVSFLDDDLMRVRLDFSGESKPEALRSYTDCAAAEALLLRGFGFGRHVRTTVSEEAGISGADAVYTVSPTLPAGQFVIDAETVAAECREKGTTGV